MSEKERSPGKAVIAFTLDFGAQPEVVKLVLSGSATIEGTRPEIQQFLATERPGRPPVVLAKIYEQVYGAVYLICNSIEVPCPLPTLMKE